MVCCQNCFVPFLFPVWASGLTASSVWQSLEGRNWTNWMFFRWTLDFWYDFCQPIILLEEVNLDWRKRYRMFQNWMGPNWLASHIFTCHRGKRQQSSLGRSRQKQNRFMIRNSDCNVSNKIRNQNCFVPFLFPVWASGLTASSVWQSLEGRNWTNWMFLRWTLDFWYDFCQPIIVGRSQFGLEESTSHVPELNGTQLASWPYFQLPSENDQSSLARCKQQQNRFMIRNCYCNVSNKIRNNLFISNIISKHVGERNMNQTFL